MSDSMTLPEFREEAHMARRWNRPTTFGAALLVFGGAWYLSHLEQVPETGRWRYMTISPATEDWIMSTVPKEDHAELPPNHPLTIHIHRVVDRLLDANNLGTIKRTLIRREGADSHIPFWDSNSEYSTVSDSKMKKREWDVKVIPSNVVNAAALPGTILVFTGILPICRDDNGLAAILSHEIGHVVARHSAEQLSSTFLFWPFVAGLSVLFSGTFYMGDAFLEYVLNRPNQRTQEKEADIIGLRMMAKACYNPKAAPAMFRRLNEYEQQIGGTTLEFFSTHPNTEGRAQSLEDMLPEAYRIMEEAHCSQTRYDLQRFAQVLGR